MKNGKIAVGVTTGVVAECCLVANGSTRNQNNPSNSHYIAILQFGQEAWQEATYWGIHLLFQTISGSFSANGGLKFVTMPEWMGGKLGIASVLCLTKSG